MRLTPLEGDKKAERQAIANAAETLRAKGVCPTCQDMKKGGVYPPTDDRTFFENDLVQCFLEGYPRNAGHTIVLVKPHFEDLSKMPSDLVPEVMRIIHSAITALKDLLGAEKVYMCTMCDGRRNHLHFQLIPRLPGDTIAGSRLFVKERSCLVEYAETVKQLGSLLQTDLSQ